MNLKGFVYRVYERVHRYNAFIPDENDYDDVEHEDEAKDPIAVVRQQKYATWLYLVLLVGECLDTNGILENVPCLQCVCMCCSTLA